MPPPDYNRVKRIVPSGGVASFLTDARGTSYDVQGRIIPAPPPLSPEERADPYVQRYIAEQKAARRPWSDVASGVGSNLYNLATEGIRPSAVVQGMVDLAGRTKRLLSGEMPINDPLDPRLPNPEAVETSFDVASGMTLGSGAIPVEANAVRAGAKSGWSKANKQIMIEQVPDIIREPSPDPSQPDNFFVVTNGERKPITPFQANQLRRMGAKFWNPNRKRPPTEGDLPEGLENFPARVLTPRGSTLNTGLGGFMQRGFQSMEGKGGGGDGPAPHPKNPAGSVRRAEIKQDGMYSKAEEVLHSPKAPKNTTVQEFTAFLKANGVKPREIDALGLERIGPQKMKREELIAYINENQPELYETTNTNWREYTVGDDGDAEYGMSNYIWNNPAPGFAWEYPVHRLPGDTLFYNRWKIRTEGDGRKVMSWEEAQSDLAQEKRGTFRGTKPDPKRLSVINGTPREFSEAYEKMPNARPDLAKLPRKVIENLYYQSQGYPGDVPMTYAAVKDIKNPQYTYFGTGARTPEQIFEETKRNISGRLVQEGSGVYPHNDVEKMFYDEKYGMVAAPYVVEGSKATIPAMLKQALRTAVAKDVDEIVVVPGEIHAKRWDGDNAPDRAKGLIKYYDDVLKNEGNDTLKELSKDMGLKEPMKFQVEKRPWMKHADSGYEASDAPNVNVNTWIRQQGEEELSSAFADIGNLDYTRLTAIRRVISDIMSEADADYRTVPEQSDISATRVRIQNNIERNLVDIRSYQRSIEDLEKKLAEVDRLNLGEAAKDSYLIDLEYYKDEINYAQENIAKLENKLDELPWAENIIRYWKENVYSMDTPAEEGLPALTLKITPELKEWIKKNGLPRFARGGIVNALA